MKRDLRAGYRSASRPYLGDSLAPTFSEWAPSRSASHAAPTDGCRAAEFRPAAAGRPDSPVAERAGALWSGSSMQNLKISGASVNLDRQVAPQKREWYR